MEHTPPDVGDDDTVDPGISYSYFGGAPSTTLVATRWRPALEPGTYPDLDEATYHRDTALSYSGAKLLISPNCPARYKADRDAGQQHRRVFDVGSAAHYLVLGHGMPIAEIKHPDYRTKAAQLKRRVARAFDRTPVLSHELDTVSEMADAIMAHPVASALFDPELGTAEQSIVWDDPATGVRCRCRVDFLTHLDARPRLIVPDYKTAESADPDRFARQAGQYRYQIQDAFYREGIAAAYGIDPRDVAFVFVVQEKTPPYLISVVELDRPSRLAGELMARRARQIFADCVESGHWPGYSDAVEPISLPRYHLTESDRI